MIGGQLRQDISEEQIEFLYKRGIVDLRTSCREVGEQAWQTLEQCLPLLKYVPIKLAEGAEPDADSAAPNVVKGSSVPAAATEAESASSQTPLIPLLKAGWICLLVGLGLAWILPPAFAAYGVALVLAIAAMRVQQVRRGRNLAISCFVATAISLLVSFLLSVGLFAKPPKPAVAKVKRPRPSTPVARATPAPVVRQYPVLRTQRERFDAITRLEAEARELQRHGHTLDLPTSDYLLRLRAEYDAGGIVVDGQPATAETPPKPEKPGTAENSAVQQGAAR